jgi:hypothetical protein
VVDGPDDCLRCVAAVFPESEVDRTCRGHRENGAHDPEQTQTTRVATYRG